MYLLLALSAIIIAISRGYTEQFIWNVRSKKDLPKSCDTSSEYHLFSVLGWLFGIFLVGISCQYIGVQPIIINITLAACMFFLYYYPYVLIYNKLRNQEWFSAGGYRIWIFEIPYIS